MLSRTNLLIVTLLCFIIWSCGDNPNGKEQIFSLTTNAKNNTVTLGDPIELNIENLKNKNISGTTYFLDGKEVPSKIETGGLILGAHTVKATVAYDKEKVEIQTQIIVLNNQAPAIYGYKITNEYPHDITSYTQGLEFFEGSLYESTGQYGKSKLRKVDYKTGKVLKNVNLEQQYFGEGLTIMNDKLYQLTWREEVGFIYDPETLEKQGSFNYGKSKEGWGLCNDGKTIFKSDGTHRIYMLNPENLAEEGMIEVYTNTGKIESLNELEFIEGKIYANIYQRNGVLIINPDNGAVEGVIDFSPLQKLVKQHPSLDVLNGIAYNPDTRSIFVTGKDWDKLFEVEVFPK